MDVATLNYLLALGAVALQIITITLLGAFLLQHNYPVLRQVVSTLGTRGLLIGFFVSFGAACVTLFYSDILGFEPCPLCWWQRIFMFPQIILFGMALWKRDVYIAEYSMVLSVIGAGIALYQHALQMLPGSGLPCPATTVSCAQRLLFEFGYITFPMLAFTLFSFLFVLMLIVRAQRAPETAVSSI